MDLMDGGGLRPSGCGLEVRGAHGGSVDLAEV
jgi:hypothetical protein